MKAADHPTAGLTERDTLGFRYSPPVSAFADVHPSRSQITLERGHMATNTTAPTIRESHKKLKPKPKTDQKSWQTRNAARKEKQAAHAAKVAGNVEN